MRVVNNSWGTNLVVSDSIQQLLSVSIYWKTLPRLKIKMLQRSAWICKLLSASYCLEEGMKPEGSLIQSGSLSSVNYIQCICTSYTPMHMHYKQINMEYPDNEVRGHKVHV